MPILPVMCAQYTMAARDWYLPALSVTVPGVEQRDGVSGFGADDRQTVEPGPEAGCQSFSS
ncbi:MAG: hypothetical protein IGS03_14780 [Candidatus Sericytochromatia bacterium]|nr:hypothetical protein [Candidatus Sericytochromatia bacterium]